MLERRNPAFPRPLFFEMMKDIFRTLDFVPTHGRELMDVYAEYLPKQERVLLRRLGT